MEKKVVAYYPFTCGLVQCIGHPGQGVLKVACCIVDGNSKVDITDLYIPDDAAFIPRIKFIYSLQIIVGTGIGDDALGQPAKKALRPQEEKAVLSNRF